MTDWKRGEGAAGLSWRAGRPLREKASWREMENGIRVGTNEGLERCGGHCSQWCAGASFLDRQLSNDAHSMKISPYCVADCYNDVVLLTRKGQIPSGLLHSLLCVVKSKQSSCLRHVVVRVSLKN